MNIKKALQYTHLALANEDTARIDAELLLCYILRCPRTFLYSHDEDELSETAQNHLEQLIKRRLQSVPMAYILGEKEFWSHSFKLTPHTLIPRPATECLIEYIQTIQLPHQTHALDLGTGSGAIAITLANIFPNWRISATDIQAGALAMAMHNAHLLGIQHIQFFWGSWFTKLPSQSFDLIISNPPYIDEDDTHLFQGDVQHEPQKALISAHQGLKDLKWIIQNAKSHLNQSGLLILEHGYNQQEQVIHLLQTHGFQNVKGHLDHDGHPRFCVGFQNA